MSYEFTQEKLNFLRSFLVYDPEVGTFTRTDGKNRNRGLKDPAATAKTYKQINVNGVIYYAHILAYWFMTGGPIPDGLEIDHEDRNKQNCKWSNLRLVTSGRNKNNRSLSTLNQSGIYGVQWSSRQQKWCVHITVDHHNYSLGRYDNFQDAVAARLAGEQKYLGEIISKQALDGISEPDAAYVKKWKRPPTGYPGVYHVMEGKFSAHFHNKRLGTFPTLEEAVAARQRAVDQAS